VAQTQPFSLQRFNVRKTPVFRTPAGGEKSAVNSTWSFPEPPSGDSLKLHWRDGGDYVEWVLFKKGDRIVYKAEFGS